MAEHSLQKNRGRFITLEGGEGVGKSTLAAGLKAEFEARGKYVVLTREPGGTSGAEALRNLLLSPLEGVAWSPLAEALLFYAARSDHLDRLIRPHLARGGWVICDRFSDSTRAYQAAAGGAMTEAIETLDRMCVAESMPDMTLILDLPLSDALQRAEARGRRPDAIEGRGKNYHQRVREAFLAIAAAHPDRCVVLDASRPQAELVAAAMAAIDQRLGKN